MKAATRFPLVFVFCATLLIGQSRCYGRTETYKLGGMREPVVTVEEGRKTFDVTARFLAVDAFDAATNQKLNRQKGQGFAFIALAQFMGIDKSQNVTITGLTPTRMHLRDRLIEVSFSFEKDTVQKIIRPARMESPQLAAHKEGDAGGTNTECGVSALSACEEDYLDTIALIDAGGRSSAADLPEVGPELYEGIADIEEETLGLFEVVRRQVESDTVLQQEERVRILSEIDRAHKAFLIALRTEFQILEASTK